MSLKGYNAKAPLIYQIKTTVMTGDPKKKCDATKSWYLYGCRGHSCYVDDNNIDTHITRDQNPTADDEETAREEREDKKK